MRKEKEKGKGKKGKSKNAKFTCLETQSNEENNEEQEVNIATRQVNLSGVFRVCPVGREGLVERMLSNCGHRIQWRRTLQSCLDAEICDVFEKFLPQN